MLKRNPFLRSLLLKLVLLSGAGLLTLYFIFRITFINFSPVLVVFSTILFLAELHTIFHLYGMFYSLWPRKYIRHELLYTNKHLKHNIFICVCGEPTEIIRDTIEAAVKARDYYIQTINPTSIPNIVVLNDGKHAQKDNWQEIEALAAEYNVAHIAREIGGGYKAGNINNGLRLTPTDDSHNTLDIVLDADFSVKEHFLTEISKPFRDQTIDFAQSPQRYKNEKTWVAKASAAHQIFFFDHICDSKGHDNALFLCGTNFAIRREALDSIGGMDETYITEDYATSLELHLKGKKGIFIPKVIAEGVAPSSLKQYFSQQQRWAKGSFDVSFAYLRKILFGRLTLRQKFHYMLSATYYLIGVRDLILMLAPLPYLFAGVSLIKPNSAEYLFFIYLPLFIYNFILYTFLFRHPIKSLVLDISSFPVFVAAFLSSAFKKNLSFIVTIKKYEKENPFAVYKLQLLVASLLVIGLSVGLQHPNVNAGAFLNFFWATFDVTILSLGFYLIFRENYNLNGFEKFALFIPRLFYLYARFVYNRSLLTRALGMILFVLLFTSLTLQTPVIKTLAEVRGSTSAPTVKKEVLIPTKGIYYGYYSPQNNMHPAEPITKVAKDEKTSLAMYYQDWSKQSVFDQTMLNKLSADGRVPVITWEPWDATENYLDTAYLTSYEPQSIINGSHDEYIRKWAHDAAAYQQPFYLRFAHEMNGNWYPWGSESIDAETYKKMWIHVHTIFEEEGADNVMWVWSPNNTDQNGDTNSIASYYPGDEYVDWVGFSGFNWGTTNTNTHWMPFKDVAKDVYGILSKYNKPIMITETSSVSTGGNKEAWLKDMVMSLPQFPDIKAVILFDQDIKNADFSMDSGIDYNKFSKQYIINNHYLLKFPEYRDLP